jgi:hypothetical protein
MLDKMKEGIGMKKKMKEATIVQKVGLSMWVVETKSQSQSTKMAKDVPIVYAKKQQHFKICNRTDRENR